MRSGRGFVGALLLEQNDQQSVSRRKSVPLDFVTRTHYNPTAKLPAVAARARGGPVMLPGPVILPGP